jgi:hypothetical protein
MRPTRRALIAKRIPNGVSRAFTRITYRNTAYESAKRIRAERDGTREATFE